MERKHRDYLFRYFFHTNAMESYFCINLTNTSKDLTGLTKITQTYPANVSFT